MLNHSNASTLARSLAKVAAAAAATDVDEESPQGTGLPKFQMNRDEGFTDPLDGQQSPILTSAFSDYGSSVCSSAAYTPSDTEADDPFEFDHDSRRPSVECSNNYVPPRNLPEPPPDNVRLFAAAIETNSLNYNFVLPSFPPTRLLEKRPNRFGSAGALTSGPAPASSSQDPFAASFSLALATSQSQPEVPRSDPMENTIAARRRRPDTNSIRSSSFVGTPDNKQVPRTMPTLRRINTDDANLGRVSRTPPSPHHADNTLEITETCPDTAVTIRPRPRAGTGSSAAPSVSGSLGAGPLTPISPPSPEDPAANIQPSPQPESAFQQKQTAAADGEMSPPATPPDATIDMRALLDSIPRQFSDGADPFDSWFGGYHSSDDDAGDMFLYDTGFYAVSPQHQRQNPLMTTASIASSTTMGGAFF
jgi:hypothetical protein